MFLKAEYSEPKNIFFQSMNTVYHFALLVIKDFCSAEVDTDIEEGQHARVQTGRGGAGRVVCCE